MSTKQPEKKTDPNKRPFTAGEKILLFLSAFLLLCGISVFVWYGSTYILLRQTSEIRPKNLEIRAEGRQCTLEIPSGKLTIQRPTRAVVGSRYHMEADVVLDQPLRFVNCTNGAPNWTIHLEAQSGLVDSEVQPFSAIRQPAVNRQDFSFRWTFIPQEAVLKYQSHLYLRVIVTKEENIIENWNVLVRDFPMENEMLFGQPVAVWLISGAFSVVMGALLLILLIQKRMKAAKDSG